MFSKAKGPKSRRQLNRSVPQLMKLEQRLMFDGAAAETVVETATQAATGEVDPMHGHEGDQLLAPAATQPPAPREIAFIDARLPDWQTLVDGIAPGIDVVVIEQGESGIDKMLSVLNGQHDIVALHILGHGAQGEAGLGSSLLTRSTLPALQHELAQIGAALNESADILLYGCNIAEGESGIDFVTTLAELTGADVAASTDATGSANLGGDWELEYNAGAVEGGIAVIGQTRLDYEGILATVSLSSSTGWTPIMMGTAFDESGDSQAGAADTDLIGDTSHASVYAAYDDNGTPDYAGDDWLSYRLRIDNPTSSTTFGGVAVIGMDANLDGKVDLFISVDGRNNTQAVRLMDPGTDLNTSPSTTSTTMLPPGWLPNNGVYPFESTPYLAEAVSSFNDPHWNGDNDLGDDGKTDLFVSFKVPLADVATVLAQPSPTDRKGITGPRGTTGIQGFTKDTVVQYVAFTQTQAGPINGDLAGVGSSYDKNATFDSLGTYTDPMSPADPVSAGPSVFIDGPIAGDNIVNDIEDNALTLSGTVSATVSDGTWVKLEVSDGGSSVTRWTQATGGTWSVSGIDLSGLSDGNLTASADLVDGDNSSTLISGSTSDSTAVLHDATAPTLAVSSGTSINDTTPVLAGTSDLTEGSIVTVTVDPDNDVSTNNVVTYQLAVAADGSWTMDTGTVPPVSGTFPSGGIPPSAKVTATATDASGNTASVNALNAPTVNALSTNDTTPTVSGQWTQISGDALTVTIDGVTYTDGDGNLTTTTTGWSLTIPGGNALTIGNTYEVTATVTRASSDVSDSTSNELAITSTPVVAVGINGGASASGSDTTPLIEGTSQNAGAFVVVRLDPGNDGDLSDAVTFSVVPDGGGNWTLDTGSVQPIAGQMPSGGFVGDVGILASDSSGSVSDAQVLSITAPTVTIDTISSTAISDAYAQVDNGGSGSAYLNITEDDAVTVSGTASGGNAVDLVIADANGNTVTANGVSVSAGTWSATGLDLSSLDNGSLTVTATLSGTNASDTDTSVVHDKLAPRIFNTSPSEIKKNGGVITGSSELANTQLTVTVRNVTDTSTVWTGTVTTDANGDWTALTSGNLVSGPNGNVIVKVQPTTTVTDAAGNISQQIQWNQFVAANASTNTISIGTIATDDLITADEIGSGVTIAGSTTLTGTLTVSLAVSDGTMTVNLSTTASSGAWSAMLSNADIQTLANGPLTVTATAPDGSITIQDVALPTLSLVRPALTITDDVPGTATGEVTFTFTFNEGVSGFDVSDITVTGGSKGTFTQVTADTYNLVVTPTASSSGSISVSVADNTATGTNTGRGNIAASSIQSFDTTGAAAAPSVTINTDNLASDTSPVLGGTTSLPPGAPVVIAIDTDNNGGTDISYSAVVQSGGTWSIDLESATPTAGSLPSGGLAPDAKVTATATNAYGNSTSVVGLNKPSVTGLTTNDATPIVSGTWTNIVGDTLSVVIDGTTYSEANSNLNISGNDWSLTLASAPGDGSYDVTATVSRGGSSNTDITTGELLIDTAASLDITSYGGSGTGATNDATPVISGSSSGLPGGTIVSVTLDVDNDGNTDLIYQTTLDGSGNWSLDTGTSTPASGSFPSGGLSGAVPITASATDPAGNVGSDTQNLNVDTQAPAIGITSPVRTPDSTPEITGTTDLPSGTTLAVDVDPNNDGDWSDQYTYNATVQTDGTWSVIVTDTLFGSVGVRVTGTDAVGNSTTIGQTLTIDPNAASVDVDEPTSSGVAIGSVLDTVEDDNVVISGSSQNIAVGHTIAVTITDGNTTLADKAIVQADGSWALDALNLSSLANGTLTVTATYVDTAGINYTDVYTFTHDKTAVVAIDSISTDTGIVADFVTRDDTIAIIGTATANATVNVVVKDSSNNPVASFTVTADSDGNWATADTSTLTPDTYTIEADVGGTTVSKAFSTVAATAPTLVSSSPIDNATDIAVDSNLVLIFDRNVQSGAGILGLYRSTDDSLVESFNVSTGVGSGGGSLTFNGTTGVILDPFSDLVATTGYYVKIDESAITDAVGNAYGGISDTTSLNFITAAVGDTTAPAAPSVDLLPASDTGASNSDDITSDTTPTLRVSLDQSGPAATDAVAGDVVKLYEGATLVGSITLTAQNISDGYVDITNSAFTAGTLSFTATVTDAANNTSASSSALSVTLDTSAPTGPVTVTSVVSNVTTPVLTGTASLGAGESLSVTVSDATYSVTPDGNGDWSLDLGSATPSSGALTPLADGNIYSVTATITDAASNSLSDSTSNEIVIDTSAPAGPVTVTSVLSNVTTPVLTGTASLGAGESLSVTVSGATYSVTPDGNGDWSLDLGSATPSSGSLTPLTDGNTYSVTATITDAAGSSLSDSTSNELTVALAVPPQPEVSPPPSTVPVLISLTSSFVEDTNAFPDGGPSSPANSQGIGFDPGFDLVSLQDFSTSSWLGSQLLQGYDSLRSSQGEIRGTFGYQLAIVDRTDPSGDHELRLEKKIPDQEFAAGSRFIRYLIPVDTFVHTDSEAKVALSAFMVDGTPLPTWLKFDGEKGEFEGMPPEWFQGELLIKVVARDDEGRQAETIVRLRVVEQVSELSFTGKPSLAEQLRSAGLFGWQVERDQLMQQAGEARLQAKAVKGA